MIDHSVLEKFIDKACKKLNGDWVIIGGSVLHYLEISHRYTEDIDIAGVNSTTQRENLMLMEIAQEIGLPIESINQAGAYFLNKIENWKDSLIQIKEGKNCRIFRPTATLFIKLKINRLSEIDLEDCKHMIAFAIKNKEKINKKELLNFLSNHYSHEKNHAKAQRLETLKKILS